MITFLSKPLFIFKRFASGIKRFVSEKRVGTKVAAIEVSQFTNNAVSDISEHLNFIYFLVNVQRPKSLIELGTRGGESTRVLEKYCRENDVIGRSIDLSPAPEWLKSSHHWKHYVGDDLSLGSTLQQLNLWPDGDDFKRFDFVFLDTSHEYEHTVSELETYIPLLNEKGMIVFHDTNLTHRPTRRLDGGINYGWNNERGVIRALEEFLNIRIDELSLQVQKNSTNEWMIYHMPWNNGLTVLVRN